MSDPVVVFKSQGLIDLEALKTFGLNAKVNDNPIGYFGTGLKYAIAVIMRHGGKLAMFRDGKTYVFRSKQESSRGTSYNSIFMGETRLNFTTMLGKNWHMWQAYRELYCNTLDEKGVIYTQELFKPGESTAGYTYFLVRHPDFTLANKEKATIIFDKPVRVALPAMDIADGNSKAIFYRDLRVMEQEKPSFFTYNIKADMMLTEDRTVLLGYQPAELIADAILSSTDRPLLEAFMGVTEHFTEASVKFDESYVAPSKEFIEVAQAQDRAGVGRANTSISKVLQKAVRNNWHGARAGSGYSSTYTVASAEQRMIYQAQKWLGMIGMPHDFLVLQTSHLEDYETHTIEGEVVTVNVKLFKTQDWITRVLIVAYYQIKYKLSPLSREMQNALIDKVIELGRLNTGEPK